jgi:hypothetical protein
MAVRSLPVNRIDDPILDMGDENDMVVSLSATMGFTNGRLWHADNPDICIAFDSPDQHHHPTSAKAGAR